MAPVEDCAALYGNGTRMKVQILGAGAVGACFGGQLARAGHEVICFARGANLAALRGCGLEIRTPEGV